MSLLATLACTAIVACQAALVRIAGAVTVSQPFVSQLMLLRRTYFALAVIVNFTRAAALRALSPRYGQRVVLRHYHRISHDGFLVPQRVAESVYFQKNFNLHWFLHLCTVEIFPVSLLWLSLVR